MAFCSFISYVSKATAQKGRRRITSTASAVADSARGSRRHEPSGGRRIQSAPFRGTLPLLCLLLRWNGSFPNSVRLPTVWPMSTGSSPGARSEDAAPAGATKLADPSIAALYIGLATQQPILSSKKNTGYSPIGFPN